MMVDERRSWQVDLPEGVSGAVEVRRFEIPEKSVEGFRMALQGRGTPPGVYTALLRNGALWMSDTYAEYADCVGAVIEAHGRGGRVLVNGLGLGMVIKAMLRSDAVEQIDVVEIDEDVIRLVGPAYERDPRVKIHHGDALAFQWPPGTRWTVAWHDIWEAMSEDNLPDYKRLKRSYGRRVDWQECWAESQVRAQMRRQRRWEW